MQTKRTVQSASLDAAEEALTVTCARDQRVAFVVSGTFTATVQFEATIDGTNWFSVGVHTAAVAFGGAVVTSATAAGQWRGDVTEYKAVRVRCSAYTSGTIVVRAMTASSGVIK